MRTYVTLRTRRPPRVAAVAPAADEREATDGADDDDDESTLMRTAPAAPLRGDDLAPPNPPLAPLPG